MSSATKKPRPAESMIEEAANAHGEIKNVEVRRKRKALIENDIAEMFSTMPTPKSPKSDDCSMNATGMYCTSPCFDKGCHD